MSDLIDTTEMYLRTLYELGEEGVAPLRARIAERLHQSGPTVSQTVARMQRDGLVVLNADRQLELTPVGAQQATAVMRKHRLAERLLLDVIGLEWAQVHTEACRWEHVMSEAVESRIVALLGTPSVSPYGNPIPGLPALAEPTGGQADSESPHIEAPSPDVRTSATGRARPDPGPVSLSSCLAEDHRTLQLVAIGEHLQTDVELMRKLDRSGLRPGSTMTAAAVDDESVALTVDGESIMMPSVACGQLFVSPV